MPPQALLRLPAAATQKIGCKANECSPKAPRSAASPSRQSQSASPRARRLAKELGVDLMGVQVGSGARRDRSPKVTSEKRDRKKQSRRLEMDVIGN